jgi:hypothetical protein
MSSARINQLAARIERIKIRLAAVGDMTPGTLSKQYNVCGNPTCRCKDPVRPQRHGPYFQLSFTRRGKSVTRFIKKEELKRVKEQIKNYALFKKLVDDWINTAIELSQLTRKIACE